MYGYIYLTTNLINNRKYIGQHKSDVFTENYKGSGMILRQALEKYGWDNFKVELLEECSSKEELDLRERYWIKEYDAVYSSEFYNIAFGGNSRHGPISDEHRKKLSELGKLRVGSKNPFYGKKLSEESKQKRLKSYMSTVSRRKQEGTYVVTKPGFSIYNNGESELRVYPGDEIPKGYIKGRLPFSPEHCQQISDSHKNPSEETRKRMSIAQKNSKMTSEQRRQVQLEYLATLDQEEFIKRYVTPKLKENLSDETLKKMSDSASTRNTGRFWINNGLHNKFINPEEFERYKSQGYSKGRLLSNESHVGKFFITDGVSNKLIDSSQDIPEGWRRGLTRHED